MVIIINLITYFSMEIKDSETKGVKELLVM
jgi:hypothetical protein